jgi:6-phosphogluconolactonase
VLFLLGTYTKSDSRGIYAARLDPATGVLSGPVPAADTTAPSFLAYSPDRRFLYAVRDSESVAAAFRAAPALARAPGRDPPDALEAGLLLEPITGPSPKAVPPCHVSVDRTGRVLLATNYHTGTVSAMALATDGTPGAPRVIRHEGRGPDPARQASAHPHSATVSPDNRFAIVCDLGLDRIFTYRLDAARAALEASAPPFVAAEPGSGPRHFAFGRDGRHGYAIHEMASTVVCHAYDAASGALEPRQAVSTLPAGAAGGSAGAEVAVDPAGRFLYASNRGHDSLAVFSIDGANGTLRPVEWVPCGGRTPRHFSLSPDGRWLVCAQQDSNTVCSFGVDPATGRLTRVPGRLSVPMPTCILF